MRLPLKASPNASPKPSFRLPARTIPRGIAALGLGLALLTASAGLAQEARSDTPLEAALYDQPGLTITSTLPRGAFRFSGGQLQGNPTEATGTGQQLYQLGVEYGATDRLSFGVEYEYFNDPLVIAGGSSETLLRSVGLSGGYALYQSGPLAVSLRGSAEWYTFASDFFGSRQNDDAFHAVFSAHLPIRYQFGDRLTLHVTPGVSVFPGDINGRAFYGTLPQLGFGADYRAADRLRLFGSVNVPFGEGGNVIDGATGEIGSTPIYTFGGRYLMSPQVALDLFLTNGFGGTQATEITAFIPDGDEPVLGARLVYMPAWGTDQPTSYFGPRRDLTTRDRALVADGVLLSSAYLLEPGQFAFSGRYGNGDQYGAALRVSPTRDLEIIGTLEQVDQSSPRPSGRAFPSDPTFAPDKGLLWGVNAKLRLLDQAAGSPVAMAARAQFSRDTVSRRGSVMLSLPVGYQLSPRLAVTAEPKFGAFGIEEEIFALGLGGNFELFEGLQLIGEATPTSDEEVVWAVGARYGLEGLFGAPAHVDVSASNAIGRQGYSSLIGQEDVSISVGVGVTLEGRGLFESLF